jgi:hypothetical protein
MTVWATTEATVPATIRYPARVVSIGGIRPGKPIKAALIVPINPYY